MTFCRCGAEIDPRRAARNIASCHACGERAAQVEIAAKAKRVAPDGNKQGYSYQGDPEAARRNILQAGKKTVSVIATPDTTFVPADAHYTPPPRVRKPPRKRIGLYYVGQEAYVWYSDLADPTTKGATRSVRF